MKKTIILLTLLSLFSTVIQAQTKMKKSEQKRRWMELAQRVDADSVERHIPNFLWTDQDAYNYCDNVASMTDEAYATDVAAVNSWFDECNKLLSEYTDLSYTVDMKIQEKNPVDPSYSAMYYRMMNDMMPRWETTKKYCDNVRESIRQTKMRTMPEGHLNTFRYSEYGSSRPDPCELTLKHTEDGKLLLSSVFRDEKYNYDHPFTIEVDESVCDTIRHMIERDKIYQYRRIYTTPPSFPQCPPVPGGPPSWYFIAKFEGGDISIEATQQYIFPSCLKVANYLHGLVREAYARQGGDVRALPPY